MYRPHTQYFVYNVHWCKWIGVHAFLDPQCVVNLELEMSYWEYIKNKSEKNVFFK